MRRNRWPLIPLVMVLGLALLGGDCSGPSRSGGPSSASGRSLAVTVSPNALRGATAATDEAQGACAVVNVIVTDANGQLVDGAFVLVSTTLGRFPATPVRSESVGVSGFTVNGVFNDVICAKAERGTGILTANSEDATATEVFTVF